jgi:hypothetical protein
MIRLCRWTCQAGVEVVVAPERSLLTRASGCPLNDKASLSACEPSSFLVIRIDIFNVVFE